MKPKGSPPGVRIRLVIECSDDHVASALNDVLMPDNRYFPKDQTFEASRRGSSLTFQVDSPRPRPAFGTVASIVSDSRLFGEIWSDSRGV